MFRPVDNLLAVEVVGYCSLISMVINKISLSLSLSLFYQLRERSSESEEEEEVLNTEEEEESAEEEEESDSELYTSLTQDVICAINLPSSGCSSNLHIM